jgi:TRAP-type C4-dicarboxylate transport system permease small subunit
MPALARSLSLFLAPISRVALGLAAFGLVLMTLFVAWQVFGRYVLNNSPSWTEPGSLLLMSWFILLGSAVGVREGDHLGFEIGLHYAPPRMRLIMRTITLVLMIGFGVAMAVYGAQLAIGTWSAKMAGVGLPQGMDYVPLVVGGVLIALFSLEKLAQLHAGEMTPPTSASGVG